MAVILNPLAGQSQKAVARLPKGLQQSSLAAKSYAEHTEHQIVAVKHTNL